MENFLIPIEDDNMMEYKDCKFVKKWIYCIYDFIDEKKADKNKKSNEVALFEIKENQIQERMAFRSLFK